MPLYTDRNVRKQERCRYYTDKNIRKQASENILGSVYKHVLGTAGKRRKKTDAAIAKIPGKHRDDTRRENTSVKIPEKYILITTKKTQAHKVRKEDKNVQNGVTPSWMSDWERRVSYNGLNVLESDAYDARLERLYNEFRKSVRDFDSGYLVI